MVVTILAKNVPIDEMGVVMTCTTKPFWGQGFTCQQNAVSKKKNMCCIIIPTVVQSESKKIYPVLLLTQAVWWFFLELVFIGVK